MGTLLLMLHNLRQKESYLLKMYQVMEPAISTFPLMKLEMN